MKLKPHQTWNLPIIPIGTWIDRAACKEAPSSEMVPKQWTATGDRVQPVTYEHAVARAKKWCAICPVVSSCRDYGLAISSHVEDHGVYGGLTMEERNEILGYRTRYTPTRIGYSECGTHGAYRRHLRNGEKPCDTCREFVNRQAAQRRRTRRTRIERSCSGEPSETKR